MAEQAACRLNCRQEPDRSHKCAEFTAYRVAEFAAYRGKDGGDGGVRRWDLLLRMQPAPRWREMLEAVCQWDLVHRGAAIPRRGRSCAGGIWLQESSKGHPCAGGIWLG